MGLLTASCQALIHARVRLGVDFARCITLGRQEILLSAQELRDVTIAGGLVAPEPWALEHSGRYAEHWLALLGAKSVESIDASDYEQATIIHDLNIPVPASLHGRSTCVIDGGTIEHVFNFPVAIRSCMAMLEVGGHYIGMTPANNHLGHGFYQFSPELYFRLFSPQNGFEVRTMLVRAARNWYEVADPAVLGERIELVSAAPVTLFVIARKNKQVEAFHTPQQSDYVSAWNARSSAERPVKIANGGAAREWARKVLPTGVKTWLRGVANLTRKREEVEGLGTVDARHFKRVEL